MHPSKATQDGIFQATTRPANQTLVSTQLEITIPCKPNSLTAHRMLAQWRRISFVSPPPVNASTGKALLTGGTALFSSCTAKPHPNVYKVLLPYGMRDIDKKSNRKNTQRTENFIGWLDLTAILDHLPRVPNRWNRFSVFPKTSRRSLAELFIGGPRAILARLPKCSLSRRHVAGPAMCSRGSAPSSLAISATQGLEDFTGC